MENIRKEYDAIVDELKERAELIADHTEDDATHRASVGRRLYVGRRQGVCAGVGG